MKTLVQEGKKLDYVNDTGSAIAAGAVVLLATGLIAIAHDNIAIGVTGVVYIGEVHELPKKSTDTFVPYQEVVWDATPGELTETLTAGVPAGLIVEEAGNGTTTAKILINAKLGGAYVAQVGTADGSDAATTQALANALKASHNALLTALKTAGIIASV